MSIKIWKNDKWIDVSGAPDMSPYQKKLVAGTGITIDEETNVISADGLADGNVAYDTDTKTLYVKKEGVYEPITDIEGFIKDLGYVPGHESEKMPYNLPYFFETKADGSKVTVTAKTISLDNKKTQGSYSLDVLPATSSTAGLMSADDKKKLSDSQSKVKYTKDEPAGASDGDIWVF